MDYRTKALFFCVVKLILIILELSTSAKAAMLELDEENSTGSFSMFLSVYSDADSDSYNYQDSGIFQVPSVIIISIGSYAPAVIVSGGVYNPWDSDWGMGGCTFHYSIACGADPYIYEDTIIPAGFSSTMNAEGNLTWEILKSTEDEDSNLPVFVYIGPNPTSAEGGGTNIIYETGIYEYTVEIGSQSFGLPDASDFWTFAHFGDYIRLSYDTSIVAATIDPTIDSGFSSGNLIFLDTYVRSPDIVFIEKEQDALVKGACSDGETQLIVWFLAGFELDLSSIRLTVLSDDGKDNGHLIQEGQDNDGDGYDDTPQIIDNYIFTQTWCAPAVFDDVEGAANTAKIREIPIQFELDIDKDGTYECVFVKNIELIRPPVVMVHGLWGKSKDFKDLNILLDSSGFLFKKRADYNNTASLNQNKDVVPTYVNQLLLEARKAEYACTKVDIVAHSMGGLLAKRLAPAFAQQKVRKIITVGTPYRGSQFADLLWQCLINDPIRTGWTQTVIDIFMHTRQSITGGAIESLRSSEDPISPAEIPGVDCSNIIVGLRDLSPLPSYFVTILKLGTKRWILEEAHDIIFGPGVATDWIVSTTSQKGDAGTWRTIPVTWHCSEPQDADFKDIVIEALNQPSQESQLCQSMEFAQINALSEEQSSIAPTNKTRLYQATTSDSSKSNGTIGIISPTEGQICEAGGSVTVSVQGSGDTTHAAVFALFGSSPWSDIVQLPWQDDVNVPLDSVGSDAKIFAIGLDVNMNMTAVDEVNLILESDIVLQDIFFGFGNIWYFDFITDPTQSHQLQLYPMGKFSDGSEHPLSISGQTNYASSNDTVATVDPNGLITVHSKGTSQITVTNSGVNTIIEVEVDTYPGDINLDLKVDFTDFAVFANQWLLDKLSADVAPGSGDGIVNFVDYAVFADGWWGDINGLADFVSQWLKPSAYCADIAPVPSGDGVVDFLDLSLVAEYWLEGTSP